MQRYKSRLGWYDGLTALIFHGQRAEAASLYNLTSIFQVAALYDDTPFAQQKLILGYALGVFSRHLAGYSEGHYLLTDRGAKRQALELDRRELTQAEVWVLDPSDPRRTGC
ncbi:hypothetical protein E4191_21565 (plasmid) [Paracoccus liaowanqingii]|uniref:Uncharacterized protein n=1 Tax=Paracoccus liaowanqingii TaxID=2560053 RepID=A0A4Y5STJ3_9RHOB|nr:hypothetical protein [Paracoccus liaowanqingii]QDA36679.1 hypothetical protein E4191_21565 [Paracoccus liaowanqingii]